MLDVAPPVRPRKDFRRPVAHLGDNLYQIPNRESKCLATRRFLVNIIDQKYSDEIRRRVEPAACLVGYVIPKRKA